jgi:hypothetical protein
MSYGDYLLRRFLTIRGRKVNESRLNCTETFRRKA